MKLSPHSSKLDQKDVQIQLCDEIHKSRLEKCDGNIPILLSNTCSCVKLRQTSSNGSRLTWCSILICLLSSSLLALGAFILVYHKNVTNTKEPAIAVLQDQVNYMIVNCEQMRLRIEELEQKNNEIMQLLISERKGDGVLSGEVEDNDISMSINSQISYVPEIERRDEILIDDIAMDEEYDERSSNTFNDSAVRAKRSTRRGKHNGKSPNNRGGRQRKKHIKRGPVAAHFKGGQPETLIQDGGSLVAPWFADELASGSFPLPYTFRQGNGAVEVKDTGLYLIYAQVYYLTSYPLNSFSINVQQVGQPTVPIAYCSTNAVTSGPNSVTEVSCYTSVVRHLNATNVVSVSQRERNRRMILRDGHSFLGLVKLNTHQPTKGRKQDS